MCLKSNGDSFNIIVYINDSIYFCDFVVTTCRQVVIRSNGICSGTDSTGSSLAILSSVHSYE
jgi:hypothetical protein